MNSSRLYRQPTLLLIALCTVLAAVSGCGFGSADLTRDSVRRLIESSDAFTSPISATLKGRREVPLLPDSADETEEHAVARQTDIELSSNPALAVMRHLGYVDLKVTVVERAHVPGRGTLEGVQPWVFSVEATLTDKGRELAKSEGAKGEKAVPLARRELIEVTGVRKEGIRGEADFTWRAVPTEAGEAFDPSSDAFKRLPEELRQALTRSRGVGPFAGSAALGWGGVQKASASFQKYDDGWRLTGARL